MNMLTFVRSTTWNNIQSRHSS